MSLLENENYDLAENEENIKDDATFDNSNKGGNKKSNKNEKEFSKKKENKIIKNIIEFSKKNAIGTYVVVGIPLFFLSVLLAAQMKTVSNSEVVLQGKREAELADELVTLQRNYNDLKEKYTESQNVVEEYKNNSSTNSTLINSMKDEINMLSALSGNTDLKGEGIIITMTDAAQNSENSTIDTDSLVHDSDVLSVVNELKVAGAEAISVNDQRIISISGIRCVGPSIQVNYQKISTPIVIKAIGNAQWLESAMNIKNGVVDTLKGSTGIGISVTRSNNVEIPKFDGTLNFKYAETKK